MKVYSVLVFEAIILKDNKKTKIDHFKAFRKTHSVQDNKIY